MRKKHRYIDSFDDELSKRLRKVLNSFSELEKDDQLVFIDALDKFDKKYKKEIVDLYDHGKVDYLKGK